jgi:hypothetical protein
MAVISDLRGQISVLSLAKLAVLHQHLHLGLLAKSIELRTLHLFPGYWAHYMVGIRYLGGLDCLVPREIWLYLSGRNPQLRLPYFASDVKTLHLVTLRAQTLERRNSRTIHLGFVYEIIGHLSFLWKYNFLIIEHGKGICLYLHPRLWKPHYVRCPLHLHLIESQQLGPSRSLPIRPVLDNASLSHVLPNSSERSRPYVLALILHF